MKLFKTQISKEETSELVARLNEKGVMTDVEKNGKYFDLYVSEHCLNQLDESDVVYCYFGQNQSN
jgi:hypothetical protein